MDVNSTADKANPAFLRDLAVEQHKVSNLLPNSRNARLHSKRQVHAIAESIRQFGFTTPILVDDDGMILAGHGRLQAAKLLGLDRVPVITISALTDAQKRALVLADNKLAERAGWDRELLAVELGELSILLPDLGLSVELTGFEVGEIDSILADVEEHKAASPDDDLVPVPETSVTQPGDLWLLGRHRLLCGDARDRRALDQLLGEDRADMVFSDPPYNVSIARHARGRGQRRHREFAMASGEMSGPEFMTFLQAALSHAAACSRDGALHYWCMDWRHLRELLTTSALIYTEMKNLIVWVKSNGGQGRLYRSQHELIGVFKVGDGEHVNNVELGRFGRNRSSVWHYAGVNSFKAGRRDELDWHPTVKPVSLVADALKDVTRRGDVVLDPFGGSGTSLIAAERTGRKARLIEIDPSYVDVAIARFEKLTRGDAVHAASGKSFAEVARARRGNAK
jgi:DNA modification methylase